MDTVNCPECNVERRIASVWFGRLNLSTCGHMVPVEEVER